MPLFTPFWLALSCVPFSSKDYPKPPLIKHQDSYFGREVSDPYRALEDPDTPKVAKWIEEEDKLTREYLAKIPYREEFYRELLKLWDFKRIGNPIKAGEYLIYLENQGLEEQSRLIVQKGEKGKQEVLLDPNQLDASGLLSIVNVVPSNEGRYAAFAIAEKGSDWQKIGVMEVSSKKKLPDTLEGVKFSTIAWDAKGFFYSRYLKEELFGEAKDQKLYYHKLGTSQSEDKLVYQDPQSPFQVYQAQTTEDGRYLILYIYGINSGNLNKVFLKDLAQPESSFKTIVGSYSYENDVIDVYDNKMYLLTTMGSPLRQVFEIDLQSPEEHFWKPFISPSADVLTAVKYIGKKFFALYIHDVQSRMLIYDRSGRQEGEIALPEHVAMKAFDGGRKDSSFYYTLSSFILPPTVYRYDIGKNSSAEFFKPKLSFSTDAYMIELLTTPSKDLTSVPVYIVRKKDLPLDGSRPTLLYGYGGFGISLLPEFIPSAFLLLQKGGVYAFAILRGGGEFGENWHRAATREKKQNGFDDFIYTAMGLVQRKYTSPSKLAIQGASNGGLLVGAVMTQRPDLFQVALPDVGVLDMLRFDKFTIGWNWIAEYGSSSESASQFEYLYGYSPLHRVKKGVHYPATLITTGLHDNRVMPFHSFKFAAALQEKSKGENPILLRVEKDVGHGMGKPLSKKLELDADRFAFMFCNFGINPDKGP